MSKDDEVLWICVGSLATIVAVVVIIFAVQRSRGYPRATVITPTATYHDVQVDYEVSKYQTHCTIYTDDGKVMTIAGSATIVWNSKEDGK